MSSHRRPTPRSLAAALLLVLLGWLLYQAGVDPWALVRAPTSAPAVEHLVPDPRSRRDLPRSADAKGQADSGAERIERAFARRESGFMVTVDGIVERRLADDRDGSRHQRFLIRLANDHTLLVAHNIDLAERVPLQKGDRVRLRGQYEWNERGGVLHWTHRDPDGSHPGGWVELDGRRIE